MVQIILEETEMMSNVMIEDIVMTEHLVLRMQIVLIMLETLHL